MYFIAIITGLVVGTLVWIVASHWIASWITGTETRQPHLFGSRRLRANEVVACGLLFIACLAVAFFVARAMVT